MKVTACFVVFPYTAPYKNKIKGQDKIVCVHVRKASCKPSIASLDPCVNGESCSSTGIILVNFVTVVCLKLQGSNSTVSHR